MDVNAFTVAAAALVTALACGLGAVPFVFGADADARAPRRRRRGRRRRDARRHCRARLRGLGARLPRLLAGVVLGVVFIALTQRLLAGREHVHLGACAAPTRGRR